jgi:hypothetical protein
VAPRLNHANTAKVASFVFDYHLWLIFLEEMAPLNLILETQKDKSSESDAKSRVQITVDVALQTITIVRDLVPFEPAQGVLGALCGLLKLFQVRTMGSIYVSEVLIPVQDYMSNEDDLSDIATRCQRVAVIIRKAVENDRLQNGDLTKAILRLHKYVYVTNSANPMYLPRH